jgi:hypothetical protein
MVGTQSIMSESTVKDAACVIYPRFPGGRDCGIVRIGGAGLGNCLYAYFHAVVAAKQIGGQLIAPTWPSIKIGPLLRRERSLRQYGTMFGAHPDEISGVAKLVRLASLWSGHSRLVIRVGQPGRPAASGLTIVEVPTHEFTFVGLHPHRDLIRNRLIEILLAPPSNPPSWGAGAYAAAHIRLGDFRASQSDDPRRSFRDGERIPLAWYVRTIKQVRSIYPVPVHVFSDGHEYELAEIARIEGVTLRREPNDVADLLALAQARLLIGSNSTFSRWAAFLGNMSSIWPNTQLREQPTATETRILYVTDDFETITCDTVAMS